jgi:hypothetical protein
LRGFVSPSPEVSVAGVVRVRGPELALLAGLAGVIGDSGPALETLVMTTMLLWLMATCWHVYGIGRQD